MATETLQLTSEDGTALHGLHDAPSNPRAVVFICHGLGEHCGRYEHVFETLVEAGCAVYAVDLRGHGKSGGQRGHLMQWSEYLADCATLYARAETDGFGEHPWIQLGHSMGGLVAVHLALRHQQRLAGLILSGPLLGVAVKVPAWKDAVGRLLANVLPRLSLENEIESRYLSHDGDVVAAYDADPLVHAKVSTRWFTQMQQAMADANQRASELELPVLLMHGTDDRLTDPEASKRFAATVPPPLETHWLEGFYHEIFNETERARPLGLTVAWLEALLGASAE